jgi:transcriptional regulator with XRE-family HTH domain
MGTATPTAPPASERVPWDERLARVHRQWPSTAERDWDEALRDYELLGGVIRDMLKIEAAPVRRGQRPGLELAAGEARLRQLAGDDWTTLPFTDAFRLLGGTRTKQDLADHCGLTRHAVSRLLSGSSEPTGTEMEAIAAAFGKPATYFPEYRVALVCAFLVDYFATAPEASVALAHRLRRR